MIGICYTTAAHRAIRCAAALFLAGLAAPVGAQVLRVEGAPCAANIHVHAEAVPLGEVVKGITAALGVRLELKTELTETVSIDRSGTPEQVLGRLLQGHNLVLDSQRQGRCQGREVLATVWLLPAGQSAPRAESGSETAVSAAPPPIPGREVPAGFGKRVGHVSAEERRRIKHDYRDGKVVIDPVTSKIVPALPASPGTTTP